jgi:TolB-like protein
MPNSGRSSLLHRLRERGVIRVAASYAVIAWLLLQIADVTFEPLGVPRWVMVSLIVTAVLGFPVAVALAWFYEAGDSGVALDTAAEGVPRPVVHGLRRYADVAIIGILLVAVAVLLVRQSDLVPTGAQRAAVAVLPFRNLSTAADGEVLALGIAESVLHQLANLRKLDVISRTSSFTFGNYEQDAREIGRQLGARYLLEGSVQSNRTRMRVTTQLIDTETGADVWSMRFDRPPGDIFEIQDDIALQVTRALELSLDAKERDRLTGQGTENLDAYLAFLQGRSLQANDRVVDMREAIGHFERAIEADPKFADAYVSLADAKLFVAEWEVTDDRNERFETALREGRELVERALTLDPENGDAYLMRAHLRAWDDLASAEADYRRGLELSPNAAKGYAGLAGVLYKTPSRLDEVPEMLDRARKLDPLEPEYDVLKAVFLNYERGDPTGARRLLDSVLERDPRYGPALIRACELDTFALGRQAEAIKLCEQALAVDPLSVEARRLLVRAYIAVGEVVTAEQLVDADRGETGVLRAAIALARKDWIAAGEAAYEVLARDTAAPNNQPLMFAAIRMHARATGDVSRAITAIEPYARIQWDASGQPKLPEDAAYGDASFALADMLIQNGEVDRGRRILEEMLAAMQRAVGDQGRPEYWYLHWYTPAAALYGDKAKAIAMFERAVADGAAATPWQFYFDVEPAFESLRRDSRFQALREKAARNSAEEHRKLEQMRLDGELPDRTTRPHGEEVSP